MVPRMCYCEHMRRNAARIHIDNASRQYLTSSGEKKTSRCYLLRRSYRDENGKPRNETIANISVLSDSVISQLDKLLKGANLTDVDNGFEIERSLSHGDCAAADVMARQLGLKALLGPPSKERDIAYGLILSRAIRPRSKLSTLGWWQSGDTTLGVDLGIRDVSTDDIYGAMDWLVERKADIERKLAKRHLGEGEVAMFDLTSAWVEGTHCELAEFGHSRDDKRGKRQIEYGLLTDKEGRPISVEVFSGNTADPISFKTAISKVRDDFGLMSLVMVGDRGMITQTRITELEKMPGMGFITALRSSGIKALSGKDGPLQMSLFDTQNLAEISSPDYPGERLICCYNPLLAAERKNKREELLKATENDFSSIRTSIDKGRLVSADAIGIRVGKVINKHKMGKHYRVSIGEREFSYSRDESSINSEAATDGIYVIRTNMGSDEFSPSELVSTYKNLKHVERDFRICKADDLDLRPIYHYHSERVIGHVLICMLALYLTWHLRRAFSELTFTDQEIPNGDPVLKANRSNGAKQKDKTKKNIDGFRVTSYRDLLHHLSSLRRELINFGGTRIEKLTVPTPIQRRAFELLGAPVPLSLASQNKSG